MPGRTDLCAGVIDPVVLGSTKLNAAGQGRLVVPVPPGMAGTPVWVQAWLARPAPAWFTQVETITL